MTGWWWWWWWWNASDHRDSLFVETLGLGWVHSHSASIKTFCGHFWIRYSGCRNDFYQIWAVVSLEPSGGQGSCSATSRLMKTCIKFMSTFNNLSNSSLAWQGWATDWYGGSGLGYWAGKQTIDAINDIGAAGVRAQHFLVCYVFIHLLFFSLLITINCCSVFQLARGLGLAGPGLEHFF